MDTIIVFSYLVVAVLGVMYLEARHDRRQAQRFSISDQQRDLSLVVTLHARRQKTRGR